MTPLSLSHTHTIMQFVLFCCVCVCVVFFLIFRQCHMACGISVLWPGTELGPPASNTLKANSLSAEPPGNPHKIYKNQCIFLNSKNNVCGKTHSTFYLVTNAEQVYNLPVKKSICRDIHPFEIFHLCCLIKFFPPSFTRQVLLLTKPL